VPPNKKIRWSFSPQEILGGGTRAERGGSFKTQLGGKKGGKKVRFDAKMEPREKHSNSQETFSMHREIGWEKSKVVS